MHDDSELYRAADMYFVHDMTMGAVAERLDVSRSTVSRMLKEAKRRGIVTVSLHLPDNPTDHVSQRFHEQFGVTAHVTGTPRSAGPSQRLDAVARAAARLLTQWVTDGTVLGVAWGTTTSAVATHVVPTGARDVTVVQLNGAVGPHSTGAGGSVPVLDSLARAFDAELYPFPTPAFFDAEETRTLLWRESSVRRILDVRATADLAVFSVGAFQGPVLSQVYSERHVSRETLRDLHAHHVVGDLCTVFLREDGSYADLAVNRRASGPTPSDLSKLRRRVCVVSGTHKVPGILGALRSGAVTDLVIDQLTARELLNRVDAPGR